jgi:DNA polymerase bacteriophage-type
MSKRWALDTKINDRGIYLDGALLEAALKVAEDAQHEIKRELVETTAGAVTSFHQTDKLLAWLGTNGCDLANLQKSTLQEALARNDLPAAARRVIELRLDGAHAATNKLKAMGAWRDGDGRVRGALKFHGASTGRWASYGIQLQNMKRPITEDMSAAVAAVSTGSLQHLRARYAQPMSVIGDITRAIIAAAPGHRFIAADLSGIESRVTAWVSGQQSKLDQWAKFDQTGDPNDEPYLVIGRRLGVAADQARSIGKTADLAFGYMGGVGAWQKLAAGDASSEIKIRAYRDGWRCANPRTVLFWRAIDRAALCAMQKPGEVVECGRVAFMLEGDFLFMRLPSGRRLSYPFPKIAKNERGDAVVVFMDHQQGKWAECRHGHGAYGGTWIENAVQAIARDLFAAAMPRLEAAGYPIVLHVHDEIVCEVPDGFGSEEEFKAIMLTLPDWAEGLPVNAKTRNGPRFCKMKPTTQSASAKETTSEPKALKLTLTPHTLLQTQPADAGRTSEPPIPPWEDEPEPDDVEHHCNGFDGNGFAGNGHWHDDNYASGEQNRGRHVDEYIYRDAGGRPYLRVVRTSAKKFPQFHFENGRWKAGKPTGPKIPYRLPELIASDDPIWICEGEKDANNVAALGLTATCNSEGAGKWGAELGKWFTGKPAAYVLEDNDDAGRRHAAKVVSTLTGIVPDIRVISFPELPEHGDVSDWLARGHSRAELIERAKNAKPAAARPDGLKITRASDLDMRGIDWMWPGRFARGTIGLIAGLPDMGKGNIAAFLASVCTAALALPCNEGFAPQGNVIWLNAEDDNQNTVLPRLVAAGANPERVYFVNGAQVGGMDKAFSLVTDLELLRKAIDEIGNVVMVIIDPVSAYLGVGKVDGRSATDVRGVLTPLKELAEEKHVAFVCVSHFNKKDDVKSALLRVSDSIAYVAAARHVYAVIEDPEDRDSRLFIKAKNNLADAAVKGLRYCIKAKTVGYDAALKKDITASYIEWLGHVDMTANEAMQIRQARGARVSAQALSGGAGEVRGAV